MTSLPRRRGILGDERVRYAVSASVCVSVTACFVLGSREFLHWFLFPTVACGVLLGMDVLEWLGGEIDTFDPKGIVGLFLFHNMFVGPLLHLQFEHWIRNPNLPADWRPWLGWWGVMNVVGLLVYRWSRSTFSVDVRRLRRRTMRWELRPNGFLVWLALFLVVTFVVQLGIYVSLGGIEGYVSAYEARAGALEGLGWLLMIAESFPVLALMGFAVYVRRRSLVPSWPSLFIVLAAFLALTMIFGGFRGSRTTIIWAMFWAVGIIHFWVRPTRTWIVFLGIAVLIPFVYAYGFYKGAGREGLAAFFESAESRAAMESQIDRGIHTAYLGGGTQVFTLYLLNQPGNGFQYAFGRTYAAALARFIPRAVWPDRPEGKVMEGTELLYGPGSFSLMRASQVWGLMGEAMLNFGPWVAPLALAVLGLAVGRVRRAIVTMHPSDSRLMLMPLLVNLCIVIFSADSEGVLFFIVKGGFVPYLFLTLTSAARPEMVPQVAHRTAACRAPSERLHV